MNNQRVILHIDMNSYFASVEQQANVFLRGKSVGVCAYLSPKGCIIASSMEAKQKGIKTGCLAYQAKQLDPQVVLVQNDPPKYRTVTKKIFQILADYTTDLETYSIDEAFLDITELVKVRMMREVKGVEKGKRQKETGLNNLDRDYSAMNYDLLIAKEVGREINQRIKQEVGSWLKSSVGISRTRFLAKLLSDNGPKDSVTIKGLHEIPEFIKDLKLTDIWGINVRMQERLQKFDINTPLDLYQSQAHQLLRGLNKPGYYLWAGLHGLNAGSFKTQDPEGELSSLRGRYPKSVGHSYCLSRTTTDKKYLAQILMKLVEKTGRRLRELEFDSKAVTVYWSYVGGGHSGKSKRLYTPIYESWDIFKQAWQPLQDLDLPDKVRMLAISVSSFVPRTQQLNLFTPVEIKENKKYSLSRALDEVNNKYGEFTLIRGSMWGTSKNAPDRIGFRKTVSWKD
jgi:DNA polymerase IV